MRSPAESSTGPSRPHSVPCPTSPAFIDQELKLRFCSSIHWAASQKAFVIVLEMEHD